MQDFFVECLVGGGLLAVKSLRNFTTSRITNPSSLVTVR